ncbi:hypothetical protein FHT87_004587 [Rhizobium sp. BK316]|nr:hypothetical protein [Rhizobium sp. BK316]
MSSRQRPIGPDIPPEVSLEEMERLLDTVAIEVVALGDEGWKLVPWFDWLEYQIAERRKMNATLDRARARVEHLAKREGVTVAELTRKGLKRRRRSPARK